MSERHVRPHHVAGLHEELDGLAVEGGEDGEMERIGDETWAGSCGMAALLALRPEVRGLVRGRLVVEVSGENVALALRSGTR